MERHTGESLSSIQFPAGLSDRLPSHRAGTSGFLRDFNDQTEKLPSTRARAARTKSRLTESSPLWRRHPSAFCGFHPPEHAYRAIRATAPPVLSGLSIGMQSSVKNTPTLPKGDSSTRFPPIVFDTGTREMMLSGSNPEIGISPQSSKEAGPVKSPDPKYSQLRSAGMASPYALRQDPSHLTEPGSMSVQAENSLQAPIIIAPEKYFILLSPDKNRMRFTGVPDLHCVCSGRVQTRAIPDRMYA